MAYYIVLPFGLAVSLVFCIKRAKGFSISNLMLKSVSSLCYLLTAVFALISNPTANTYGSLIIFGGALGLVGDILLDLKGIYKKDESSYLKGGFLFFLAGHLFYSASVIYSIKLKWWIILICIAASFLFSFLNLTLSKLINDSFPDDTPQKQRVLDLINHKKELAHSFVMCFSILEDDAAQWERYSDNAYGVCLKFNTKTLVKICDSNKYWMKKVVYSLKEKNNHNYNRLSCYINTGLLLDSSSIKELIMELSLISLYHKHPSFQSEQEVRIIQLAEAERDSYQYKEINNTIKRMFVFDLKQHGVTFEDLIDGIIIAPRSQQSVEELKTYIDSLGFHKLSKKIRKSDCPLR